jgi:hypothetical protein
MITPVPTVPRLRHRKVIVALAALPMVCAIAACRLSPSDDAAAAAAAAADGNYLGDARGAPTGITNGAPPDLGHAVCKDIEGGAVADNTVLQVANLQLNDKPQFTTPPGRGDRLPGGD